MMIELQTIEQILNAKLKEYPNRDQFWLEYFGFAENTFDTYLRSVKDMQIPTLLRETLIQAKKR